jgi:hypothetical protein
MTSIAPSSVSDEELDRARAMFVHVFGPDYGLELCSQLGEGEFNRVLMCRIAPNVWQPGEADIRVKVLCAIAVCTAVQQDIRYFVRAAIHHGISRRQIEEIILLAGLEGGFPAASVARRLIEDAYQQHLGMLQRLGRPPIQW